MLVFERLQESRADARGRSDFLNGHAAHFALALQTIAERCRRHPGVLRLIIFEGGLKKSKTDAKKKPGNVANVSRQGGIIGRASASVRGEAPPAS